MEKLLRIPAGAKPANIFQRIHFEMLYVFEAKLLKKAQRLFSQMRKREALLAYGTLRCPLAGAADASPEQMNFFKVHLL